MLRNRVIEPVGGPHENQTGVPAAILKASSPAHAQPANPPSQGSRSTRGIPGFSHPECPAIAHI
jgi:hypothetical protein